MLKPLVQVQDVDGVLVAEFWDCLRLDPAPVKDLRQHFEAHVKGGGRPDLVIDLLGVAFAGSASLGGFMALHRLVGPLGGRIIFCNVDETVFEVFRISKLSPMFEFVADRPVAMAAIQSRPDPKPAPASTTSATSAPPAPRAAGPLGRRRKPI